MSTESSILVLHVDDDPGFRSITEDVLSREMNTIVVESCSDTSDGIERLEEGNVDCVVSDYDMPGMNGLEFVEHVRSLYSDLPFILFTGKGSEEIASDAISAGVTDYIQKGGGFDRFDRLVNSIHNAVEYARASRARQRHHEAIETAQVGISILEDDGEFIYVNEAYANLYRYERDELIGEHWEVLYPEDDIEFAREVILPTVDSGGVWRGETTGLRTDGSTFAEDHVVSRASTGDLVCSVRDITDGHEKEREIRQKTRAMNEAPIGIVITDPTAPDNPLVYVNEHFEIITGYPRDEILGRNCRFLQGERTRSERVDRIRTAVENEEHVEVVLRNYRKDGNEFWNRLTIAPVKDENGTLVNFVGFQEDVTEQVNSRTEFEGVEK